MRIGALRTTRSRSLAGLLLAATVASLVVVAGPAVDAQAAEVDGVIETLIGDTFAPGEEEFVAYRVRGNNGVKPAGYTVSVTTPADARITKAFLMGRQDATISHVTEAGVVTTTFTFTSSEKDFEVVWVYFLAPLNVASLHTTGTVRVTEDDPNPANNSVSHTMRASPPGGGKQPKDTAITRVSNETFRPGQETFVAFRVNSTGYWPSSYTVSVRKPIAAPLARAWVVGRPDAQVGPAPDGGDAMNDVTALTFPVLRPGDVEAVVLVYFKPPAGTRQVDVTATVNMPEGDPTPQNNSVRLTMRPAA